MAEFDAVKVKNELVEWIRNWFEINGKGCNAVVGVSGGKDSSVVAALCCEALGKDRVIGVLMPQGTQSDISYSYDLVKHLGVKHLVCNIGQSVIDIMNSVKYSNKSFDDFDISNQAKVNTPARVRMTTLFCVAQSLNGRVSCNCNLSEDWVGFSSFGGDAFGSFAPLAKLTVTEVKSIGRVLRLPGKLIEKTPTDGLCGQTDEMALGFSYAVLDKYIRTGEIDDLEIKKRIDYMHEKNLFKVQPMPHFEYKA